MIMGLAGYTPEPLTKFQAWLSDLVIWGLLAYWPLYFGALIMGLFLKKKEKTVLAYRVSLAPLACLAVCGSLLIIRFVAS